MRKVSKEQALLWLEQYEAGASLYDLQAKEAAKGSSISAQSISKAITLVGGTIRTFAESMKLAREKYKDTFSD